MSTQRNITRTDQVFLDTDRILRYSVYQPAPNAAVPQDVTGWSLAWVLRAVGGAALITKTTGGGGITITGVYDTDPDVNTQRVDVQLQASDTYNDEAVPAIAIAPGTYIYALKRTDAGQEDVLAWGTFDLLACAAVD
jgi:hypothetical protein